MPPAARAETSGLRQGLVRDDGGALGASELVEAIVEDDITCAPGSCGYPPICRCRCCCCCPGPDTMARIEGAVFSPSICSPAALVAVLAAGRW